MNSHLSWILLLIIQCALVTSQPLGNHEDADIDLRQKKLIKDDYESKSDNVSAPNNEKVISIRITSSVAIGRTKVKQPKLYNNSEILSKQSPIETTVTESLTLATLISNISVESDPKTVTTTVPPELIGANLEYIKQLDAKKKTRDEIRPYELLNKYNNFNENEEILEESPSTIDEHDNVDETETIPLARKVPLSTFLNNLNERGDPSHVTGYSESFETEEHINNNMKNDSFGDKTLIILPFNNSYNNNMSKENTNQSLPAIQDNKKIENLYHDKQFQGNPKSLSNHTDDSLAESSLHSTIEIAPKDTNKNIVQLNPQISSAAVSQQNYFQDFNNKQSNGRSRSKLTSVSFNIVHDSPQIPKSNNNPTAYMNPVQILKEQQTNYQQSSTYSEAARIYSEPAKFYSEPAKIYSEPSKIYSEPAKIYSEPAKIYSEPAKIYSEPAKFYSEPASLHLGPRGPPNLSPWQHLNPPLDSTTINTTPATTIEDSPNTTNFQGTEYPQAEENYEVDENVSVLTNGRSHGVQTSTEKCKEDNCKVGYVVEGRQFKKYRVEERTSDGFLVGEYGVVRNEDGALRGVRYTADSDASPRLIYDALMKFLQLR